MKFLEIVFIVFICCGFVNAQNLNDGLELKNVTLTIFQLSKNKNAEELSTYIAYQGEESSRKRKSSLIYQNPVEKDETFRILKRIKAFLEISDSYDINTISVDKKDGLDIYRVIANFKSDSQIIETEFIFIKPGNKFLLLEIN